MKSVAKQYNFIKRGRYWLSKWLKRHKEEGSKGLTDRSRAPKRIGRKTPGPVVKKILSVRGELESHKTRCSAFSGIGAEVVYWELKKRTVRGVPGISTIAKILSR